MSSENIIKRELLEILDFERDKILKDRCTSDELKSVHRILSECLQSEATVSELAEYFGQSEANIRNVISRRYIPPADRPKRRVYYRFSWFASLVPKSWRKTH